MTPDYSLYLVTDRELAGKRPLAEIVMEAVAGGVTCVQLREKDLDTRQFIAEAREIHKHLKPLNIPLIINDRIDVAQACGAEGVHLGQSDMHLSDARDIMGAETIIGISAESLQDAIDAEAGGADYIGVSPVFATSTKKDIAPPLGLEGVADIRKAVGIPLVGIGGINGENCAEVIGHGAHGIAVVSAIMASQDPEEAAGLLRARITPFL